MSEVSISRICWLHHTQLVIQQAFAAMSIVRIVRFDTIQAIQSPAPSTRSASARLGDTLPRQSHRSSSTSMLDDRCKLGFRHWVQCESSLVIMLNP